MFENKYALDTFSQIHRRAAYHFIKEEKEPSTHPKPHHTTPGSIFVILIDYNSSYDLQEGITLCLYNNNTKIPISQTTPSLFITKCGSDMNLHSNSAYTDSETCSTERKQVRLYSL